MNVSRRGFLSAAAMTAAAAPMGCVSVPQTAAAGVRFRGWTPGDFQAHFIYTGVGESVFLIFPDSTSMLLDCGDAPAIMRKQYAVPVPDPHSMGGERVADYVLKVNPNGKAVDYMMTSHWHDDHTGSPNWQSCGTIVMRSKEYYRSGFGIAAEKLVFKKAIDRGYPTFDDPIPKGESWGHELDHMKMLYKYLQKRDGLVVEKFRLGATDQIVPTHGGAAGFEAFNIAANGKVAFRDGRVKDAVNLKPGTTAFNENAFSLGVVFSYGPFRFYTAGDFSHGCNHVKGKPGIEGVMAEACGEVDVAKMNHHGHHSMPAALVKALKARCYVACLWDQLHVTPDTMTTLADRSLYPDDRFFFPGVFPKERLAEDAGAPWLKDVVDAVKVDGAHVVLTVPKGGRSYTMTCLDPADMELRVKAEYAFRTKGC